MCPVGGFPAASSPLFTSFRALFRRFFGGGLFFGLLLGLGFTFTQIRAQRLGLTGLAGLIGTGRTLTMRAAGGVIVCAVLDTVGTGHLIHQG